MDKPDVAAVLDATHLEALEELVLHPVEGQDPPEIPGLSLADAVTALRRIGYYNRCLQTLSAEALALITPLQAQIDQVITWQKEQAEELEQRKTFHESRLQAYYHLNPPAKGKTLKLPGGSIARRDPPPKWVWEDEKALIAELRDLSHPAVRMEPVLDKNVVKELTEALPDGSVIDIATGLALTGVRVVAQTPVYTVKVEEAVS